MDYETELAKAQQKLDEQVQRTKDQRAYRNDLLRRAMKNGMTWSKAQSITGMSPRGVQKSISE
jgi:hypothetical protein